MAEKTRRAYDETQDIILWEYPFRCRDRDYFLRGRSYKGGREKIEVCFYGATKQDGTRWVNKIKRFSEDEIIAVYNAVCARKNGVKPETKSVEETGDEYAPPPELAEGDEETMQDEF